MIPSLSSIPLSAVLTVTIPCIFFILSLLHHLYRQRHAGFIPSTAVSIHPTPNPIPTPVPNTNTNTTTTTHQSKLKPLLLRLIPISKFQPNKSTLPREFYGLPPRPSGNTTIRSGSRLSNLFGKLGSTSTGIESASLPRIIKGGLPFQDNNQMSQQRGKMNLNERSTWILQIILSSSLIALVTGTVYLSIPSYKWNGILLGLAVSVVPWSTLFCVIGLATKVEAFERSVTWGFALCAGMVLSTITGVLGVVASGWIVLVGSTTPMIITTAFVILSSTINDKANSSLHPLHIKSYFQHIRLPTQLTSTKPISTEQRRTKLGLGDRILKRGGKERSFYSGPDVIIRTDGLGGRKEAVKRGEDEDEGVEVVTNDITKRSDSWLTSPSRHSSYETDRFSSFSYSSNLPSPITPVTPSSAGPRRARGRPTSTQVIDTSHSWHTSPVGISPSTSSARYSTASEGVDIVRSNDGLAAPERCASRAEVEFQRTGSNSHFTSSSSPHQSLWDGHSDSPSIIRTGNPFEMSFMTSPDSVSAKTAYHRETNGNEIRLTRFEIVPPVPLIRRMDSQYSVGNSNGDQSFPHSVSGDDDMSCDFTQSAVDGDNARGRSMERKRSPLGHPPVEPLPTSGRASFSTSRSSFALSERLQQPVMENLPPLPAARGDGMRSPGASSTIYSPTSAWNKDSTDPLLANRMFGVSAGPVGSVPLLHTASGDYRMRGASVDELMWRTDEALLQTAQEASDHQETASDRRLKDSSIAVLGGLWLSWAFSIPAQLPTVHGVAATVLFLVALLIYGPLLGGCYVFLRPVLIRNAESPRPVQLKVPAAYKPDLESQPRTSEGLDRIKEMPSRSLLSASDSPAPPRWSQMIRPQPSISQFGFRKSTSMEDGPLPELEAERNLMQKRMSRPISDVWVENGQARRHSGRLERIISTMAPHPRLSVLPVEQDRAEECDAQQNDPETTPRPSRRLTIVNKTPKQAKQSPFRPAASPAQAESSILNDGTYGWIHPSAIEHEQALDSFEMRRLRGHSFETDPDSRSIKNARVVTAMRAKVSRSPTFYFANTNELQTRLDDEPVLAQEIIDPASLSGGPAPPPLETAPLEGIRRFSTRSFGGKSKRDEAPQRRRTFDFEKLMWRKKQDQEEVRGTDMELEMDWLSAKLIQNLVPGVKIGKHASFNGAMSTIPAVSAESILGRRTSCSTSRASMDIPPFRPSLDLYAPPFSHGRSSSIELAMDMSFDAGEAEQSTPKRNIRRRAGHKSNRSLPVLPAGNLVEEIIEALDEYGRSKDTPVRNFTKLQVADMRRKSPAKGILKKTSSTSLANSSMIAEASSTHDLPPLPDNLDELLEQYGRSSRVTPLSASPPAVEQHLADEQTTPKATCVNLPYQGHVVASSLSTVAEHSGEISAVSSIRRRVKMSISTQHMLDVAGPAVPADDDEVIEEMEMMLGMDSPTVETYMASIDGTSSRPVSIDGGDSWLIRRPSKSSLTSSVTDDIRSLVTKKSSDTVKTTVSTATTATASSMESMPTPSPSPMHPQRDRLTLLTSMANTRRLASVVHDAPTTRLSLGNESLASNPASGLRPPRLLGDVSTNVQATRVAAGKGSSSVKGAYEDDTITSRPPSSSVLTSQPQHKAPHQPALPKSQVRRIPVPAVSSIYQDENDLSERKTPNLSRKSSRANISSSCSPKKAAVTTRMR